MKKGKDDKEIIDHYDYMANAASTTDATGLIPANPFPDVVEMYEDVFHFEPPKIKKEHD